jgi:hypothetical protein
MPIACGEKRANFRVHAMDRAVKAADSIEYMGYGCTNGIVGRPAKINQSLVYIM